MAVFCPVVTVDADLLGVRVPTAFGDAALCGLAADELPSIPATGDREGPAYSVAVSPGAITLRARDLCRINRSEAARADERSRWKRVTWSCGCTNARRRDYFEFYDPHAPAADPSRFTRGAWRPCSHAEAQQTPASRGSGRVREWSRKSRARMVHRVACADWSVMWAQGLPAMVTLTYPGEWEAFAPDARTVKAQRRAMVERYARAFGFRPAGLWKLEFQRRGAPHIHWLMPIPRTLAPEDSDAVAEARGDLDRARARYAACSGRAVKARARAREAVMAAHARLWAARWVLIGDTAVRRGSTVTLSLFRVWVAQSWSDVICARQWAILADWTGLGMPARDAFDLFQAQRAAGLRAGTAVDLREGLRMRDPKRVAVYFLKHSSPNGTSKEYQHIVPAHWCDGVDLQTGEVRERGAGPGRFWGLDVVPVVFPERAVSVADFMRLRRFLRRWAAGTGRRPVLHGSRVQGGWVLVNDGPGMGSLLARALALCGEQDHVDMLAPGVHPSRARSNLGRRYAVTYGCWAAL